MDTDWPLIAVRFALYVTLSGLFGLSAFSLYGLKAGERADAIALRPWLVGSGLLGLLFSGIGPCALFGHRFTVARNWSFRQRPCGGHDRAGLSIPAADIMKRGSDLHKTARARMPGDGVKTARDC